MLKPLSEKTLEKKYAELGLSKEKIDMLHRYFLCFSNLYGVILVRDAWDVFKHYEGIAVHKKDFAAFSGIVRREAGHPYSVYELKELYRGEESNDPLDRMIVNNKLISSGYYRFIDIYNTFDRQGNKPYYLPDKEIFLTFTEDRFYRTPCGKAMRTFIENLKTNGIRKDYRGNPVGEITELNGTPVKGKRLSECVFYTNTEQLDIEYVKAETKKQKLRDEFNCTASEKILHRIRLYIMTGGAFESESPAQELQYLTSSLDKDYGVSLSEAQFEQFAELFMNLNNSSNLWLNSGWSPDELFSRTSRETPSSVSIGPNMKKLFASGELDKNELEKALAKFGIAITED